MKLRENEDGIGMGAIKRKAMEYLNGKSTSFKASDGWYKKFCLRNQLNMKDKYSIPLVVPR